MKSPFLIAAAVLFAATIALGFLPVDTQTQASPTIEGTPTTAIDFAPMLAQAEPPAEAFDTSTPPEEPEPAPAEKPESKAGASCPAASKSASSSSGSCSRDFRLFDGDGYLIDRRGEAAASGDGDRFPVLKRLLGVDRRQARRACGRGLFRCRRC